MAAAQKVQDFNAQGLAKTLCAIAKTGTQTPDVFEALCAEASRTVQDFNAQDLANALKGFATSAGPDEAFEAHAKQPHVTAPLIMTTEFADVHEYKIEGSQVREGPRERARYGHRGLRIGEASHPGPTRLAVTRADGSAAVLSLIKHGHDYAWQLTTGSRLQSAP